MEPRFRRLSLAIALLLTLLSGAAAAEIYRWTDESGRQHFTQDLRQVPAGKRAAAEAAAQDAAAQPSRLQTYSSPSESAPGPRSTRTTRRGKRLLQIPFEKRGNAMFVSVRINDRVTAPFMVDTGASDVLIPAAVASEAGIYIGPNTERRVYQTANGLVSQAVVQVDALEVGEVRVEGVSGSISESMNMGLLGGTFFNQFTFQIDPGAHVITLVPNDRTRGGLSEQQWRERFRDVKGRMTALERYVEENHFTRESRVAQLDNNQEALREELDALEGEADRVDVPQAWRE